MVVLVPAPEEFRRWHVQLDCGCIHEVLIHLTRQLPLGPFYDPVSRRRLPEGQIVCCLGRTGDEHPYHYQEMIDRPLESWEMPVVYVKTKQRRRC